VRFKAVEFEGTPREFRESGLGEQFIVSNGKANSEQNEALAPEQTVPDSPSAAKLAQDEDFLRRMLRRSPVSRGQREFYGVLAQDAHGGGTARKEIGKQMGRTQKELDGVLGALGKRVNGTQRDDMDAAIGIGVLFDIWWADDDWQYRLRPAFAKVLREERIIE
jgi:hypothetical protein